MLSDEQCALCGLEPFGEVVVWKRNERQPLALPMCAVHLDTMLDALLSAVERVKGVPA